MIQLSNLLLGLVSMLLLHIISAVLHVRYSRQYHSAFLYEVRSEGVQTVANLRNSVIILAQAKNTVCTRSFYSLVLLLVPLLVYIMASNTSGKTYFITGDF